MAKAISQLTAATAVNDTDEFPINQAGTSKKATGALVRALKWYASGVLAGTRPMLNFIQGLNVSITLADNAGTNTMDVTIASAAVAADDAAIKLVKQRLFQ